MATMTVEHEAGDRFAVRVRDHRVVVDQPVHLGGADTGPTPTELFVAGLAGCVAFYGRRFLARHHLPEDLRVTAEFDMSEDRPARVAAVRLRVEADVPPARLVAFRRVLEHCTVHNSLRAPPGVVIAVEERGAGDGHEDEATPAGAGPAVRALSAVHA
jgi:uncharacterized OsmC-like protein